MHLIVLGIYRFEKGQAENMVPMDMGKENIEFPVLLADYAISKPSHSRAGIDNDDLVIL
jgi:hypothetical protein